VGCYIWYSEEGTGRGPSPPRPLLAVPNVTAHPLVLRYSEEGAERLRARSGPSSLYQPV